MGVRIVRFSEKGAVRWGRLDEEMIIPFADDFSNLSEFLERADWRTKSREAPISMNGVTFLSPITSPCQVICQGKNYLDHLVETGVKPKDKDFNILFTKADSSLAPPVGKLRRPPGVQLLDYEIELGLVIASKICSPQIVSASNLPEFIAGLVMANDVSARDIQVPQRQWFKGKSFRGFCPVGPVLYLLDKDDFSLLDSLDLELSVNGKTRQKGHTGQLMFKPAETLTEISQIFDLRAGDLLLTGTPGGVAMRVPSKGVWEKFWDIFQTDKKIFERFVKSQESSGRYLRPGDLVESSIRSSCGRIDLGKQKLSIV